MKKLLVIFVILSSLLVMPVSAYWGNNNNNPWSNPYSNLNPYEIWNPRYWIEELEQIFDNNDYWGNNYNNSYGRYRNNPYRSYNGYNRNYGNQSYGHPSMMNYQNNHSFN
jgi:hypothetical protein